jgi:hypothetical protein
MSYITNPATQTMIERVKSFGLMVLNKNIKTTNDLSQIKKLKDLLDQNPWNFQIESRDYDVVIKNIIEFAEYNHPNDKDLLDKCIKTILYLVEEKKRIKFEKLNQIEFNPELFSKEKYIFKFMQVFIDKNWDENTSDLDNSIKKDICESYFQAIQSLLNDKDSVQKIKKNIGILNDLKVEIQDMNKKYILNEIWHTIFIIDNDWISQWIKNFQLRIDHKNLRETINNGAESIGQKNWKSLIEYSESIIDDCVIRSKLYLQKRSEIFKELIDLKLIKITNQTIKSLQEAGMNYTELEKIESLKNCNIISCLIKNSIGENILKKYKEIIMQNIRQSDMVCDTWEYFSPNEKGYNKYYSILKSISNRSQMVTIKRFIDIIKEVIGRYQIKIAFEELEKQMLIHRNVIALKHWENSINYFIENNNSDTELLEIKSFDLSDWEPSEKTFKINFQKNENVIKKFFNILTCLFQDSPKNEIYQKIKNIRMSTSKYTDYNFIIMAFKIFSIPEWHEDNIPIELDREIRNLFLNAICDTNISFEDILKNMTLLKEDLKLHINKSELDQMSKTFDKKTHEMIDKRALLSEWY